MHSRVLYAGDDSTRLFAVPFPYLAKTDVKVYLNKFPLNHPMDYRWVGDSAIEITKAPKQNDAIEVARLTEDTRALVQFQNGAVLTEHELNLAMLQMLYLLQETRDAFDAALGAGLQRVAGSTGIIGATAEDIINNVVNEVLASDLTALLQQRISDIDINAQQLIDQRLRLDTLDETIAALTNVDGQSIATFLLDEQNARIEGDTALASKVSLIGAANAGNTAFVLDLAKVLVSPTESLGSRLTALQSKFDANAAAILSEQTTRATADSALATQISNVVARVGTAEGAIVAEQTARATADSAMTTRVDAMQAKVEQNAAAITTEQTARATADSALSTRIDTVSATATSAKNAADSNTAAIQTEQTARANGDSAIAQSVQTLQSKVDGNSASIQTIQTVTDGLKAQYMVKADVNGYVAGFGLYNTGATSQFIVLADKFAVVTPGATPTVPFAVDANGVYMPNAFIRNLTVDKITGGSIQSQWNLNNTSGRIVLDTGTFMKVLGVGFGANADLIEWFGPKMAVNLCTKANAITYVGTAGDAYFGGTLKAGTLYNAQRSTNTQVPNDLVLGPYATNGNAKTIVVSYACSKRFVYATPGSTGYQANSTQPYVDLQLFRKLGTLGSETLLASWRINGDVVIGNEFDGVDVASVNFSGAYTYTDNTPGTDDRTYTVRLIARQDNSVNHSSGNVGTITYSSTMGIVSTEQ